MFWIFLLAIALAATFTKLGAASVMISVLSMGLQVAVGISAFLVALLLWKHFVRRDPQERD